MRVVLVIIAVHVQQQTENVGGNAAIARHANELLLRRDRLHPGGTQPSGLTLAEFPPMG